MMSRSFSCMSVGGAGEDVVSSFPVLGRGALRSSLLSERSASSAFLAAMSSVGSLCWWFGREGVG